MSKAIHWQIPFISRKGTSYRIDIYDTYTGSVPSTWPVTLQGADSVLDTQENNSNNLFEPVRSTTGTLHLIDEDGTLMEQIVPANNIDRLVRLVSISGNTTTTEWQGFLSCEAYSQEYIANAKILDINVNGILEALDSVQLDYTQASLKSVRAIICDICDTLKTQAGLSSNVFDNVVTSYHDIHALSVYIDTTILFELREYNDQNNTFYKAYAISCKNVLSRICTFFGWVVREQGTTLYFQRIGETHGVYTSSYTNFKAGSTGHFNSLQSSSMSSLNWTGANHSKTVVQGANSVGVNASVKQYAIDMKMPDCPSGDTSPVLIYFRSSDIAENNFTMSLTGNRNSTFNELMEFKAYELLIDSEYASETQPTRSIRYNAASTPADVINNYSQEFSRLNYWQIYNQNYVWSNKPIHLGAFISMMNDSEFKPALCILGVDDRAYQSRWTEDANNYIFSMRSKLVFRANDGYLVLKYHDEVSAALGESQGGVRIDMALNIGDRYWNGSQWVSGFCTFYASCDEDGNYEGRFALNTNVLGEVRLRIYYRSGGGFVTGAALSELSIGYEQDPNTKSNRDTNRYMHIMGGNFRDEIAIDTELASDFNNKVSPSIIQNSGYGLLSKISYVDDQGQVYEQRPEEDLVDRMTDYYDAPKRTIELEAEHPTAAALPLLTITGYDNKTYIPIAESRNWQEDTATLTLMES